MAACPPVCEYIFVRVSDVMVQVTGLKDLHAEVLEKLENIDWLEDEFGDEDDDALMMMMMMTLVGPDASFELCRTEEERRPRAPRPEHHHLPLSCILPSNRQRFICHRSLAR